jgi:hypothetical protein
MGARLRTISDSKASSGCPGQSRPLPDVALHAQVGDTSHAIEETARRTGVEPRVHRPRIELSRGGSECSVLHLVPNRPANSAWSTLLDCHGKARAATFVSRAGAPCGHPEGPSVRRGCVRRWHPEASRVLDDPAEALEQVADAEEIARVVSGPVDSVVHQSWQSRETAHLSAL